MIYIAHRANLEGPDKGVENSPSKIASVIGAGFDAEVDVSYIDGELWLGHDVPSFKIQLDFLDCYKDNLWIHCKNIEALECLLEYDLNCFGHCRDEFVVTSRGYIFTCPGSPLSNKAVLVMPERQPGFSLDHFDSGSCYGICSDFAGEIRREIDGE